MSDTVIVGDRTRSATDQETFQHLAEPYRREIQLHCYRMLGSLHDAEDLVQETFLRAWRGRDRFEGRTSFRSWLYRIATNACLNARRANARRVLPETLSPPAGHAPLGAPEAEIAWLEPYPDAALEGIADVAPGPDARYEMHEAVQFAFVAAIQELPPRQRAVLLLRDVLGWSAGETAVLLHASVASINSALQRARATLKQRFPTGRPSAQPMPDDRQRRLLERYVKTWEDSNLEGFVALLREDAVLSMPPWRQWYSGRMAITEFMAWVWRPDRRHYHLLVPTAANRQPAFGHYRSEREGSEWRAFGIQLLMLQDDAIASLTNFVDTRLFNAFDLPPVLPAHDVPAAVRHRDPAAGSTTPGGVRFIGRAKVP